MGWSNSSSVRYRALAGGFVARESGAIAVIVAFAASRSEAEDTDVRG